MDKHRISKNIFNVKRKVHNPKERWRSIREEQVRKGLIQNVVRRNNGRNREEKMERYWENRGGWCTYGLMFIFRATSSAYDINSVAQHHVGLHAKCHTHFCAANTGILGARTTLLLNAAPSSSISWASAVSPFNISHLGESGIHLWQLYVSIFIFRAIETLRTLCHS